MNGKDIQPASRGDLGPLQALARVIQMFYAPRRTAAQIREAPNWAFPLLLSMLVSFLVATVVFSRPEWQQALQKNLDVAGRQLGELEKVRALSVLNAFGWVGALLSPVIGNLILTVLLWGAAVLMEGRVTFLSVFSLQLHAQMVTLLPEMVGAGLVLGNGSHAPGPAGSLPTNLAYFFPASGMSPSLRSLATVVDLFDLWYWALVVVGLAVVAQLPRRRVFLPVGILWAVGVLFKAATVSLFSAAP